MWHQNFRIEIPWQQRKNEFGQLNGTMTIIIDICLGLIYGPYKYIKFHWLCIEDESASSLRILADPIWTGYVREQSTACAGYWYSFNKRMQLKWDFKYLIVPVSWSGPSTTECTELFSLTETYVGLYVCTSDMTCAESFFKNIIVSNQCQNTYGEVLNKFIVKQWEQDYYRTAI